VGSPALGNPAHPTSRRHQALVMKVSSMIWSPQQDAALLAVRKWLREQTGPQVFRLFGFAGTGKTSLIKEITRDLRGRVVYAAYTGKAASVMRSKGCLGADTIHGLIYRPSTTDKAGFSLNRASEAAGAELIVIDECSMVDAKLARDLLSFGRKALVIGDPAQLPPPKGAGFFTMHKPDVLLTEVHRQAQDNPIIALATRARLGKDLPKGQHGSSWVLPHRHMQIEHVSAVDQILVHTNNLRHSLNQRLRDYIGRTGKLPMRGEKLLCERNQKRKGFLNGTLWEALSDGTLHDDKVLIHVRPEDHRGLTQQIAVPMQMFEGDAPKVSARTKADMFSYGYALTVHKAQGSQWGSVTLFDEYRAGPDKQRWLYTALTRAVSKVIVVQDVEK
jgi:exodeoxyribonuclease V